MRGAFEKSGKNVQILLGVCPEPGEVMVIRVQGTSPDTEWSSGTSKRLNSLRGVISDDSFY